MAAKTGKFTANGARKKFLRRDFGDLEVQMGMEDVTSPVAVLRITDFGNNWGEMAWYRIRGQNGTSFGQYIRFFIIGETCVTRELELEAQGSIVGERGGEGPNIPEGLK